VLLSGCGASTHARPAARPKPTAVGPPLAATITASPKAATTGQNVAFAYSITPGNPSVGIPKVAIDFGDGTVIDGGAGGAGTAPVGNVVHIYTKPGTYTASVRATAADGGTGAASVAIAVAQKPPPPAMQLKADPATPQAGEAVSFSYSISGLPEGASAQLQINYGDGASDQLTGTSGTASHSFAAAGSYPVILTALDATRQVLGAASVVVVVGG
jgi:PKD repeat protein